MGKRFYLLIQRNKGVILFIFLMFVFRSAVADV